MAKYSSKLQLGAHRNEALAPPPKPKQKAAPAPKTAPDPTPARVPDELQHHSPSVQQVYLDLRAEILAVRSSVTTADRTLLVSFVEAHAAELRARRMAAEADGELHLKFSRAAQAEGRAKKSTLAALGLSGSRLGASTMKRQAHAMRSASVETAGKATSKWN